MFFEIKVSDIFWLKHFFCFVKRLKHYILIVIIAIDQGSQTQITLGPLEVESGEEGPHQVFHKKKVSSMYSNSSIPQN